MRINILFVCFLYVSLCVCLFIFTLCNINFKEKNLFPFCLFSSSFFYGMNLSIKFVSTTLSLHYTKMLYANVVTIVCLTIILFLCSYFFLVSFTLITENENKKDAIKMHSKCISNSYATFSLKYKFNYFFSF